MRINEIETIPQSDYRGGRADLPGNVYNSYDDIAKKFKLRPLPYYPGFEYYIDQQFSYHDVIIYIVNQYHKSHVAKMVLEKLDTNTHIKFAAFPIPNSYTVEGITTDESWRGQGLAMALYNVAINELGYTLVSGSVQTPGGQRNWVNLYRAVNEGKLQGVEITGWIQLPATSDSTYYDELFGELGGVYMGTVNRFEFYEIPVGLVSNQKKLETLLTRGKIKIYVHDIFGELQYRSGLVAKRVS